MLSRTIAINSLSSPINVKLSIPVFLPWSSTLNASKRFDIACKRVKYLTVKLVFGLASILLIYIETPCFSSNSPTFPLNEKESPSIWKFLSSITVKFISGLTNSASEINRCLTLILPGSSPISLAMPWPNIGK